MPASHGSTARPQSASSAPDFRPTSSSGAVHVALSGPHLTSAALTLGALLGTTAPAARSAALDAVVTGAGFVDVWLNDGGGGFTAQTFAGSNCWAAALGDLDGDGDLDAVVANIGDADSSSLAPQDIWINDGSGHFTAQTFGGGTSFGVALGDLDGDGDLDAVIANYLDQPQDIWINDGSGHFTAHTFGRSYSTSVALGELDGPIYDFGDAPAPYPTTEAGDGARHILGGGLHLGSAVDAEPDGAPQIAALGDDLFDFDGDDEDGVTLGGPLRGCTQESVTVSAGSAGKIDAWIDGNADGDWDDPGEQVLASVDVAAGVNNPDFQVPCDTGDVNSFARFRLSSAGGLSPTGAAADGEVEDHAVILLATLDDGNGIDPTVEAQVPGYNGSAQGDGNGNGVPDYQEPGTASVPSVVGDCWFTVTTAQGYPLRNVMAVPPPANPAIGAAFPCGMVSYQVELPEPGAGVDIEAFVYPPRASFVALGKSGPFGLVKMVDSVPANGGGKAVFGFHGTDGGDLDEDNAADSVFSDPVGPIRGQELPTDGLNPARPVPALLPWGLGLLGALLGLSGYRHRRRR